MLLPPGIGMRDYPLLNGFVQKRVIILGKELFYGTNMVHESSPLSEPLMAAGNFCENFKR